MDYIKIPSGEFTNLPLLEQIGRSNKELILSTGMSNVKEIKMHCMCLINRELKIRK